MSFLKSFGTEALKILHSIEGAPTVIVNDMKNIPQDIADIKSIVNIVKMSEAMFAAVGGEKTGASKLVAAQPYVEAILSDVEVLSDGTKLGSLVQDQAGFNNGVNDLITAFVRILNACKPIA